MNDLKKADNFYRDNDNAGDLSLSLEASFRQHQQDNNGAKYDDGLDFGGFLNDPDEVNQAVTNPNRYDYDGDQ